MNTAHNPHSAGGARNSRPPSINKKKEVSGSALKLTDTYGKNSLSIFGLFKINT